MTDKAMVTLPKSVIDWILGEGPNDKGEWFEQPVGRPRYWWRKDLRAALSAALAQAEQPVAVKPLEWAPYAADMFFAPSIVGDYVVGAKGHWWLRGEMTEEAVSVDAAKAAAQADYERRVLSALAHPPAKREAGETLKPRDNVVVDSVFGPVGGIIVEPVEGWWKVQFRDDSIAVVRPSSIRAALEASHE